MGAVGLLQAPNGLWIRVPECHFLGNSDDGVQIDGRGLPTVEQRGGEAVLRVRVVQSGCACDHQEQVEGGVHL